MVFAIAHASAMHNKDMQQVASKHEERVARLCAADSVATVAVAAKALRATPPAHVQDNKTLLETLCATPLPANNSAHDARVLYVC